MSTYIIKSLISRLQQIRKQGVPWWLLYTQSQGIFCLFFSIFQEYHETWKKMMGSELPKFWITHLQAIRVTAPPYNITSLMHKIKLIHTTQSQTMVDDRNWHRLGLTSLYLTHYHPASELRAFLEKSIWSSLFFWTDRRLGIIILRKKKRQSSHFPPSHLSHSLMQSCFA